MILITLSTLLFLKYKYFIHHIISIIIFAIISFCIDILLDNFEQGVFSKKAFQIIFDIIIILLEILNYCYQKYMMEKHYHNYWNVAFALGVYFFILSTIYLIMDLIQSDESIKAYFTDAGAGYIILDIFLNIFLGFITYISRILSLDYLTPNHMLISYESTKIFYVLLLTNYEYKWYSIILFFPHFIILLFYLEIFEFNFWNLNFNK